MQPGFLHRSIKALVAPNTHLAALIACALQVYVGSGYANNGLGLQGTKLHMLAL